MSNYDRIEALLNAAAVAGRQGDYQSAQEYQEMAAKAIREDRYSR